MDFSGLPDDTLSPGLDLSGLPDNNAKTLREQYRTTTGTPDEAAKVFDLSARTGVPKPVVERNKPRVERQANEPDWDALEVSAPVTVRELAANAKMFELANDDTENLREIERTFNRRSEGKIGGAPFVQSPDRMGPSQGPTPSFSSTAYGLYNSFIQGSERARQGVRLQAADAFGFDEMFADALRKRDQAQFRQDITTPAFESATARGIYGGGASTLQNLPGIAASILTRSPTPALAAAGVQTELDAYGKYRSRGATPGQALTGAVGEGAVEVATEMIPMRTMLGAFGQPGKTAAKEFLKSQVQEQFGEQAATILQDAIDTAVANPDKTWGEYLKERPDAAYQTFLATLVQSGVMTAGHTALSKLAGDEAKAQGAAKDAEAIAQISQLAAASKLRTRDPQTFNDFVTAANEDGPVQDIYIDARTLQQAGIDPMLLAQASPSVAAQLEEALATGGDLIIPMAEYATKIAGTELDPVLTPHLRTSEEALSLDEAQRFYQGQAEEFKKAAAKVMEEKQTDTAWQQSAKAVETKLFEQLQNTGRFTSDVNTAYSTLMRDFYVTTAARLGITPTEMFDRYPLRVATERMAGGARMEQGVETPAFKAWFGDSKVVDAQGSPLVVYHGTNQSVKAFDPARIGARDSGFFGTGFYFTPDKDAAADYADTAVEDTGKGEAAVMPLYVSLKNPFAWDMSDENADATRTALAKVGITRASVRGNSASLGNAKEREVFNRLVREQGYDGVIVRDEDGVQEVVAFRPEQIKSAIGNSGAFNPNDPNILKQEANPLAKLFQTVTQALGLQAPAQEPPAAVEPTPGEPLDMGQFFSQPAYHGSPYRFDKFSLEHMGKGEGAQAYGWGLYFAGNKAVAEFYRKNLTTEEPYVDGELLDPYSPKHLLARVLSDESGDAEEARSTLSSMARPGGSKSVASAAKAAIDLLDSGARPTVEYVKPDGQLYEVDIPEDDTMLHWDKPLSEQPEKVRAALPAVGLQSRGTAYAWKDGLAAGEMYRQMAADFADRYVILERKTTKQGNLDGSTPAFEYQIDTRLGFYDNAKEAKSAFMRKMDPKLANADDAFAATHFDQQARNEGIFKVEKVGKKRGDEIASKYLNSLGINGIKYLDGSSRDNGEGNYNYVIFDDSAINILNTYYQDQEGNRGEIAFGKDITQTPSVITLFKNADLSTLLHEMGHFQLEVLANIAARPDAPVEITQDMDTVLKWFGVADLATWRTLSLEEKRPYHEQFARGFEAYLFEGRAPNTELNGVFARFRAWLINVYKSIQALNVEISDDIRGVFDRLVATEEAIKQAEEARSYGALFKNAEEMGDAELYAEYQRNGAEATQTALDGLQRKSLRDMQWLTNARSRILKQMQKDAAEKRKAVEAEVRAEVKAMPVYTAINFLKKGEMVAPDGEMVKVEKGYRLDTAALAEMYPESMLARPALERLQGMTRKDGLHPDLVAQMFGFTSGDHLVREIIATAPEAEMIEGMTDQRVLERYGDLANPDTLARATDEAIHNEARARFVATELKALSKATGPVRVLAKAAKDFATATLARKKVREIKPNQYAAAETRAAKAAEKALKAGDTALAATEKRNQLVQNYGTRLAYDALDEIDRAVKYVKKFDNEATRKAIDISYREQIDAMRERFDFRSGQTLTAIDKRASLAEWITSQEEMGFEPTISEELRNEAFRKHYKDLTLEELRGVVDAIKNIEHLGRLKKKLLTAAEDREFDAAVQEIVGSIQDNAKGSIPPQRSSERSLVVRVKALFRYAAAIHRKFASLVREFDGFKDGGSAWEYLVRNMNDRGNFEAVETEKATRHLAELLKPITQLKLREKQYFPSIGRSFSREERIGIALNMGNEVNVERVMTGERLSPTQLAEVLNTLSKEETDFVQAVWDYFETFRPQLAEKERRLTGIEPKWVEPTPWVTQHGTYKGGYYPIAYDPLLDDRASADINAEVQKQLERGLYVRAQTARGHLKARTESTGRPLRYDFGEVISRHVTQVVHDLAWHEYLIDANRLLRDKNVQAAIREHYGPEVYTELKDTLKDIAIGAAGTEKGAKFFDHLRYGVTIAGLGFNIFNTLQNLTGITQSFSRVGTGWVLKGAAHWAGDAAHMESSIQKIHEKSDFMRLRAKTMLREINEIRNKVSGNDSKLQAAYFWLQSKTQLMVDVPTWWGAYEKAMSESDMTEAKAIALADQAVIDAQGSGQIKDLAGVQRGGSGLKLFTTFYSFFNTTFNNTAEAYGRTDFKKPKDLAMFAADMALLYTIPALLSTLLKAALQGDWDDKEKLARKLVGDQISYMMGTVVGVREMAAGVQAATGSGEGFGYTGPASVRFFADFYNLGKQIQQGEADEAFWKALNNEAGILFHYPAGQINRTASGIAALSDGRTENPMALLMGAPKK